MGLPGGPQEGSRVSESSIFTFSAGPKNGSKMGAKVWAPKSELYSLWEVMGEKLLPKKQQRKKVAKSGGLSPLSSPLTPHILREGRAEFTSGKSAEPFYVSFDMVFLDQNPLLGGIFLMFLAKVPHGGSKDLPRHPKEVKSWSKRWQKDTHLHPKGA